MNHSASSHEFALYTALPNTIESGDTITLIDKEFLHRIERVLRLKKGEHLLLFDRERHIQARIMHIDRKECVVEILSIAANSIYTPHITFLLPILKRDALSDAVYYLVETGVNAIQLIASSHQHRAWGGQKELERLQRVCVAAAEQAKQFAFPELKEPIPLSEISQYITEDAHCFYGDPEGIRFDTIALNHPKQFVLTCGPEADFFENEKEFLRSKSFQPLRLTPTILRAETAALCLSSLFRTVFN